MAYYNHALRSCEQALTPQDGKVNTGQDNAIPAVADSASMEEFEEEEQEDKMEEADEEDDISEILVPSSNIAGQAVLELLAEQGQFHNASTEMMAGVKDDACGVPVHTAPKRLPRWRDGDEARRTPPYIVRTILITAEPGPQSILAHPAVRPYVDTNGTCVRYLYVPADMKECPAWRKLVHNPAEIVLALYFDGVPVWRSQLSKRGGPTPCTS
eukprot:g7423.t1